MDVQEAMDDLRSRTLAHMPRPLDRLVYLASTRDYSSVIYYMDGPRDGTQVDQLVQRPIYLASTRDYNTGLYYHDGLAARFSADVVCEALANCHRETFHQLIAVP